jgi:hypothetical protein
MKSFRNTLAFLLAVFLFASCGGDGKKKEQSDEAFDLQSYMKAAEAIDPDLEKVDQVFSILDMVNAEYFDALTNDPYNAHSYKTSYPVAAANLGIYMTDIIYHHYGEDNEDLYLTFQAAQELARHIGVESQFATMTIEGLEGTLMKRDTITKLFNRLMVDSENYNSEQELVFVHTAFLTGSFVEKVYISSNLLKQKMSAGEMTNEQVSDIKELLIIYLNQLNPSTGILFDAYEKQQEQLEGLVILSTFEKLRELSEHLKNVKTSLVAASVSDLASNEELNTTFELISNLRTVLISAGS